MDKLRGGSPGHGLKEEKQKDREAGAELSENWDPRQLRRSSHDCKDFGQIGYVVRKFAPKPKYSNCTFKLWAGEMASLYEPGVECPGNHARYGLFFY